MRTIRIYLEIERSFIPKVEYVFRTFCRKYKLGYVFLCEPSSSIDVYYGNKADAGYPVSIFHNPDAPLFFRQEKLYNQDNINFSDYKGIKLPFLFSMGDQVVSQGARINKDIISSAFYLLSCWQEAYDPAPSIDKDNRYEHTRSLQFKGGFTEIPVVDYYFKILADCINVLTDYEATLYLSHDIDYYDYWSKDYLKKVYKHNFRRLLKKPLPSVFKISACFLMRHFQNNPAKLLENLINQEMLFGYNSTFYLMVKSSSEDQRQHYFKNENVVKSLRTILKKSVVGLHGTQAASINEGELSEQWNMLNEKGFNPESYRNHYLCFDYQKTFLNLEKNGVKIDSTLAFHEHIGFRAGISTPFYPYYLSEDREFKVLEIPLTIMDTTLISPKKMNLSYHRAKQRCYAIINHARNVNGQVSLLWHNNSFDKLEYRWLGKLYWELLQLVSVSSGDL